MGISSATNIGKFKAGDSFEITNYCQTGDCTQANLTSIAFPDGTVQYFNSAMTQTGQNFNYTFVATQLGEYTFNTCANPGGSVICDSDTFDVTSTGGGGSLIMLILILSFAVIFFIASLFAPEEFFVYISGVCFLIAGIYLMVNGIDVLNDTNTRYLAFISLGIGLLFTLGAYIYNYINESSDSEEEY